MGVVHGGRQMVIPDMGLRVRAPRSAAAPPWWQVAGKTCVVAYQAKGAASYAASLVNLANPGTYDATEENGALSWAAETGWTSDGTTSLRVGTGISIALTWTMFVRYAGYSSGNFYIAGYRDDPWTNAFSLNSGYNDQYTFFRGSNSAGYGSPSAAGVLAIASTACYVAGSSIATVADGGTAPGNIFLFARNYEVANCFPGTISSFALYSDTLTSGEVAMVSAAMAAL